MKTTKFTSAEKELARKLFEKAEAEGTLRTPRANAAFALGSGPSGVIMQHSVTWRDYLRDARQALKPTP